MSRRRVRPRKNTPNLGMSAIALLVALAVIPAYFNIQSSVSFEPDKAALVRSLALIAAIGLLVEARGGAWSGLQGAWSSLMPGFKWLLALLVMAGLATLLGVDAVTAFWGNHERGYGFLSILAGATMAVSAYQLVKSGRLWLLIDVILLAAAIPMLYGLLQVFGYDPVTGRAVSFVLGQRASSTPGNPLFLADFLLMVLPLGLARLLVGPALSRSRYWGISMYLLFLLAALIATGSLTALGAGISAIAFLLVVSGRQKDRRGLTLMGVAILAAGFLLLLLAWVIPESLPSRLSEVFASGGSGGQRMLFWQAVFDIFRHEPRWLLTGLGPDNLALKIAPYLPAQIAHFEVDWVFRLPDRAHTWLLDTLSMVGLPGVGLWLVWWTVVVTPLVAPASRRGFAYGLPLLGTILGALMGVLLVGPGAMPVGFMAGWLGGVLALAGLRTTTSAPTAALTKIAPFLLAALVAHWVFLIFSFRTHTSDLLAWTLFGVALALPQQLSSASTAPKERQQSDEQHNWLPFFAGAAAASFGFSLSAAWPGAMALWGGGVALLFLLSLALGASSNTQQRWHFFLPIILLLPALQFNRLSGASAIIAYSWLLLWLLALIWLIRGSSPRRVRWLMLAAPLLVAINLPLYGDIAYKHAILTPYDAQARSTAMDIAFRLSPYDHVLATGIIPTEMITFPADSSLNSAPARKIITLYEHAMKAQPLAPEPPAAYAEWLRQRAEVDASAIPIAFQAFQ
ncbi:MAG: hypothetical protein GXP38_09285, partial [Chloroflexi bacterium]|nr:hypothetical protein [Chloroflexota bacterium]